MMMNPDDEYYLIEKAREEASQGPIQWLKEDDTNDPHWGLRQPDEPSIINPKGIMETKTQILAYMPHLSEADAFSASVARWALESALNSLRPVQTPKAKFWRAQIGVVIDSIIGPRQSGEAILLPEASLSTTGSGSLVIPRSNQSSGPAPMIQVPPPPPEKEEEDVDPRAAFPGPSKPTTPTRISPDDWDAEGWGWMIG